MAVKADAETDILSIKILKRIFNIVYLHMSLLMWLGINKKTHPMMNHSITILNYFLLSFNQYKQILRNFIWYACVYASDRFRGFFLFETKCHSSGSGYIWFNHRNSVSVSS